MIVVSALAVILGLFLTIGGMMMRGKIDSAREQSLYVAGLTWFVFAAVFKYVNQG